MDAKISHLTRSHVTFEPYILGEIDVQQLQIFELIKMDYS